MKKIGVTLIFFAFIIQCLGQPIIPKVTSFDRFSYKAGRQNWDITEDKHGILYFANNKGLLLNIFGTWDIIPTKYNDSVISVVYDDDKVWTGGHKEYGYFYKNNNDKYIYQHCGSINNGQAWEIETLEDLIYIRTEDNIIIYDKKNDNEEVINGSFGFSRLKKWNNKIWVIDNENNFGYIKNNQFIILEHIDSSENINHLFIYDNELYLTNNQGEVYSFNGGIIQEKFQLPSYIYEEGIFCIKNYNDKQILIGSISSGLFLFSIKENKIIQHITVQDGLMDNTILSVFLDNLGNIWCALDYGISKIEKQKELKTIFNQGATYSLLNEQDFMLLATNKGLYYSNDINKFQIIPKSQGQVWNLKKIDDKIYVCHDKGLFEFKNKTLLPIYTSTGVMDIEEVNGNYLFSMYSGLYYGSLKNKKIELKKDLNYSNNPKLYLDKKENTIWGLANHGVLHQFHFSDNNLLTINKFPEVKKLFLQKNEVLFLVDSTLCHFDKSQFKKINRTPYNLIKGEKLRALKIQDKGLAYAYIKGQHLHMSINISNGNYYNFDNLLSSLSQQFLVGFEFLEFKEDELQIATERGVEIFNPTSKFRSTHALQPVITKLICYDENKPVEYFYPFNEILKFKEKENHIKFLFSISNPALDVTEYRSKLLPFEDKFTPWGQTLEREFTSLNGGEYEFILEARSNKGLPQQTKIPFNIARKWYQTYLLIFPILVIVLLSIMIINLSWKSLNIKAEKRQQRHQQITFDQKTLAFKNEQLVTYAEELSKKNNFLRMLRDGLSIIKNKNVQVWIKRIDEEMNNEKKNLIFYNLFTELHQDFINLLHQNYPQLTSHDHRLIALIRFNLTNDEIANIMNITNRSVIMNRYRLRKKMNIEKEVDLDKFLKELA